MARKFSFFYGFIPSQRLISKTFTSICIIYTHIQIFDARMWYRLWHTSPTKYIGHVTIYIHIYNYFAVLNHVCIFTDAQTHVRLHKWNKQINTRFMWKSTYYRLTNGLSCKHQYHYHWWWWLNRHNEEVGLQNAIQNTTQEAKQT